MRSTIDHACVFSWKIEFNACQFFSVEIELQYILFIPTVHIASKRLTLQ